MRLMSKLTLAGAAACALAGSAYAADRSLHQINVALPDGSVAHVLYRGDVAPTLELVPVEQTLPVALLDSPMAGFDQIFADMDRQAAMMLQQARAMQAAPASGMIDRAPTGAVPAGMRYSFTSYSSNDGGCTQSYQMTAYGNAAPNVVSHTSGDCSPAGQRQAAPTPVRTTPVRATPVRATPGRATQSRRPQFRPPRRHSREHARSRHRSPQPHGQYPTTPSEPTTVRPRAGSSARRSVTRVTPRRNCFKSRIFTDL